MCVCVSWGEEYEAKGDYERYRHLLNTPQRTVLLSPTQTAPETKVSQNKPESIGQHSTASLARLSRLAQDQTHYKDQNRHVMYPDCPSLSGLGKRHEAADKTHKHHVTGNDSSCPPVPCDHRVVIPSSRCVCVSSRCLQSRSAFLFSFRVSSFLNDVDKLEGSHKMEYELNLITVFWYLALSSVGNIEQHFLGACSALFSCCISSFL